MAPCSAPTIRSSLIPVCPELKIGAAAADFPIAVAGRLGPFGPRSARPQRSPSAASRLGEAGSAASDGFVVIVEIWRAVHIGSTAIKAYPLFRERCLRCRVGVCNLRPEWARPWYETNLDGTCANRPASRARSSWRGTPPQTAPRRCDRIQSRHVVAVGSRPRLCPAAGRDVFAGSARSTPWSPIA